MTFLVIGILGIAMGSLGYSLLTSAGCIITPIEGLIFLGISCPIA